MRERRPTVVTVIGVLTILASCVAIFGGLGQLFFSPSNHSGSATLMPLIMLAEGIGIAILGFLLLRGNRWAWIVTLGYFVSGILMQSIALFGVDLGIGFLGFSSALRVGEQRDPFVVTFDNIVDYPRHFINIAIHSTGLFFLLRSNIRRYFRKQEMQAINL